MRRIDKTGRIDKLPHTRAAIEQLFVAMAQDGVDAAGILVSAIPSGTGKAIVVTAIPSNVAVEQDGTRSKNEIALVSALLTASGDEIAEMLKEQAS
jgi:hypothetical protein